jgi:hypothetical protein
MPKKDKPVDLEDIEDVGIARGDRYYKEALRSSPRVHEGVIRGWQGKSGRVALLVGISSYLLLGIAKRYISTKRYIS